MDKSGVGYMLDGWIRGIVIFIFVANVVVPVLFGLCIYLYHHIHIAWS